MSSSFLLLSLLLSVVVVEDVVVVVALGDVVVTDDVGRSRGFGLSVEVIVVVVWVCGEAVPVLWY